MNELESILQSIDKLTAEEKLRIVAHILDAAKPETPQPLKVRIFGLHPDAIKMSDDFTDELPDSFWLGEE